MQNLINAIEELIMQKRTNIRYRTQERDNITRSLEEETEYLWRLEAELEDLKRGMDLRGSYLDIKKPYQ